jgi:hypothetical protein
MLSSAALKPAFKLDDLEDAIWQFDEELKQFGPNLKDLINNKGKVSTHNSNCSKGTIVHRCAQQ